MLADYWTTTPELDAWLAERATPGWVYRKRAYLRRDSRGRFTR